MFERIVLATDWSPAADRLFDCLPELKKVGMQQLLLISVGDLRSPRGGMALEYQKLFESKLKAKRDELAATGLEVSYAAPLGFPPQEMVKAAERFNASLILIGSRGSNMFREFFLGSTVADLIRIAPVPVLIERLRVVKDGEGDATYRAISPRQFTSVLFATDFSKAAGGAERAARHLAKTAQRLVLLDVVEEGNSETEVARLGREAHARLSSLAAAVAREGLDVKVRVESGTASREINRVAEEEDSSVIVVGKRGRGRLLDLLLGSTAEAVARTSRRSVLLVPHSAE